MAQLSLAAQHAQSLGARRFARITPPWPEFLDDVRTQAEKIIISYRADHRVAGALHQETNYSRPQDGLGPEESGPRLRHIRKPLTTLKSESDLEDIVDPAVRAAVKAHVVRFGGDLKKAFADEKQFPYLRARDGRIIPIRKGPITVPVYPSDNSPQATAPASGIGLSITVYPSDDSPHATASSELIISSSSVSERRFPASLLPRLPGFTPGPPQPPFRGPGRLQRIFPDRHRLVCARNVFQLMMLAFFG